MLFKMDAKPNFTVENEATISAPPKVDFNKTPPAAPAPAPHRSPTLARSAKVAATPDAAAELLKKGY